LILSLRTRVLINEMAVSNNPGNVASLKKHRRKDDPHALSYLSGFNIAIIPQKSSRCIGHLKDFAVGQVSNILFCM
jgi:hypothetical protein